MSIEKSRSELSTNEKMYLYLLKSTKFSAILLFVLYIFAIGLYVIIFVDFTTDEIPIYESPLFWYYFVINGVFVSLIVIFKKRKKVMTKILDQYIRQSYYLTFQMQKPEGKNFDEKFMSLAENVFPTLKEELRKGKTWQVSELEKGYPFEISMKTHEGLFLLKRFTEEVKFEDIEKMVRIVNRHKPKKGILRMVCLAKNYDDWFFTEELDAKMEALAHKVIKFKTLLSSGQAEIHLNLDLIIERENGYTVLWLA